MFCPNCGVQIPDDSAFCEHCGCKVEGVPTPEPSTDVEQPKKNGGTKKIVPVRLIVVLSIAVLLIAGIVMAVSYLFPLEVSVKSPKNTSTTTGFMEEVVISITSNQPIRKVKYAIEPEDEDDLSLYTKGEIDGGLFEKELTIEDISVPPGTSKLFIYVKTLFGEYQTKIKFTCEVGDISEPKEEDIVWLDDHTRVVKGELLIGFKDNVSQKNAESIIEAYGGEVVGSIYVLNHYQVRFEGDTLYDLETKIEQLMEEDDVVYATYNYVYQWDVQSTPSDTEYDSWKVSEPGGNNWHFECVDAPGAWDHHDQMETVKVGVIDSCLFYDHEDLEVDSERIAYLPTDDFSTMQEASDAIYNHTHVYNAEGKCRMCGFGEHGTHVSGIIGAIANNKQGVCGADWNSELYFSNAWYYYDGGNGTIRDDMTYSSLLYSITYLAMSDCRVINMSIGGNDTTEDADLAVETQGTIFEDMFHKLNRAGYDFLIVKAAGNDNVDASHCPLNRILTYGSTAKDHVIIVGAASHTDVDLTPFNIIPTQYSVASYSNYGSMVDIVAPGTDVYSTVPDGYDYKSGTSMAAPMVAGVAGMVYGVDPSLTAPEVKEILTGKVNQYCAKEENIYPLLNAHLAVEHAMGLEDAEPAVPAPEAGYVTGIVQDADTEQILENAAVMLKNNETEEEIWASVLDNGTYYLYAEAGTYTMFFRAEGYLEEIIYDVEISTGIVTYNVLLNMVPDEEETGTATGRVVDAFDASSIPNAAITVYRGINSKTGDVVLTATADENGMYNLNLEPGNYTLRVSAEGYTTASTGIIIIGGNTKSNQDCTLTPILNEGELRVVLTWGAYPSDLDSHLVGPTPDGSQFHVYYSSKNSYYNSEKYVNLDVDDTTSYGPETTSVYVGVPNETYTFYVHDFTNCVDSFSNEMATSGAVVKVYIGGVEEAYVFNVPSKEGTLWKVFSVKDGVLTPVNEMSYQRYSDLVGQ